MGDAPPRWFGWSAGRGASVGMRGVESVTQHAVEPPGSCPRLRKCSEQYGNTPRSVVVSSTSATVPQRQHRGRRVYESLMLIPATLDDLRSN